MLDAFDNILGQPQVRDYLRSSLINDRITHAYLFTGPAGSNKLQAAYALAQALVCPKGPTGPRGSACGACDGCSRAKRRVHPDIHYFAPEGASAYLVEQIRDIVADVSLAPIQSTRKVYILDRADLMNVNSANAFLKTLEEPPENVVFLLLGRTRESVLPTISSRCQIVPFRHIPPTEAAAIVSQNTGADAGLARQAIEACSGSITGAIGFIREKGHARIGFRRELMGRLSTLSKLDLWQTLKVARELVSRSKALVDEERAKLEAELEENKDLFERSAIRRIEAKNKRQLSIKTSEYLHQCISIVKSWLRDVMMVASGAPELIVNTDFADDVKAAAAMADVSAVGAALRRIEEVEGALDYNVSPETCLDAILFQVREVLNGTGRSSEPALQHKNALVRSQWA
ncbi:MAG: DNA polymerase III subunit [Eggerthellaceae bacterium]|nr:DNA polymerase III subunit [Eggerthellaceae bacterium]